jgi:hypothetical protein
MTNPLTRLLRPWTGTPVPLALAEDPDFQALVERLVRASLAQDASETPAENPGDPLITLEEEEEDEEDEQDEEDEDEENEEEPQEAATAEPVSEPAPPPPNLYLDEEGLRLGREGADPDLTGSVAVGEALATREGRRAFATALPGGLFSFITQDTDFFQALLLVASQGKTLSDLDHHLCNLLLHHGKRFSTVSDEGRMRALWMMDCLLTGHTSVLLDSTGWTPFGNMVMAFYPDLARHFSQPLYGEGSVSLLDRMAQVSLRFSGAQEAMMTGLAADNGQAKPSQLQRWLHLAILAPLQTHTLPLVDALLAAGARVDKPFAVFDRAAAPHGLTLGELLCVATSNATEDEDAWTTFGHPMLPEVWFESSRPASVQPTPWRDCPLRDRHAIILDTLVRNLAKAGANWTASTFFERGVAGYLLSHPQRHRALTPVFIQALELDTTHLDLGQLVGDAEHGLIALMAKPCKGSFNHPVVVLPFISKNHTGWATQGPRFFSLVDRFSSEWRVIDHLPRLDTDFKPTLESLCKGSHPEATSPFMAAALVWLADGRDNPAPGTLGRLARLGAQIVKNKSKKLLLWKGPGTDEGLAHLDVLSNTVLDVLQAGETVETEKASALCSALVPFVFDSRGKKKTRDDGKTPPSCGTDWDIVNLEDSQRFVNTMGKIDHDEVKDWVEKITNQKIVLRRPMGAVKPVLEKMDSLLADFPHFEDIIGPLREHFSLASVGDGAFSLPPLLLAGPPGTGKTFFFQKLAGFASIDYHLLQMETINSAFAVGGMETGWSGSTPGFVFQRMMNSRVANPLFLLDEIDKLTKLGNGGDPANILLGLLEPHTARAFVDRCVPLPIDARKANWVATANDLNEVTAPVKSRFEIVHVPNPDRYARRCMARAIYATLLDGHAWGTWFDRAIPDETLDTLVLPEGSARNLRKILTSSLARAALAGDHVLRPEYLPDNGPTGIVMPWDQTRPPATVSRLTGTRHD